MKRLRVGLVGLGVISRYYVAALRESPMARLAAVCDRNERVLAEHGPVAPATYLDHRVMLRDAGLDAVVVTVPNDRHAEVCRDALDAGLAVCVEKPLALRASEGRELAAHARTSGGLVRTAFHRRYNSAVLDLPARLPPGVPIAEVTVRYLERIEEHAGRDTWYLDARRCGGGCVADNGPNAFDLVRFFLGEVAVSTCQVRRDASGTDRWAEVTLDAGGGATARVELDWSYAGERKDVAVRLADGTTRYADMLRGHPGFKDSLWHEYVGVVEDFARRARGAPAPDDGGVAALSLVEAAYRAETAAERASRSAEEGSAHA